MTWSHWPLHELERTLDAPLLDRLETVIPRLAGAEFDPGQMFLRRNLVRLVAAFTPSEAFTRRDYMRKCLNYVPAEVLEQLSSRTGVGLTARSFDERVEAFVRHGWRDPGYAQEFLAFFGLPEHFLPDDRAVPPAQRDFHPPSPERPVTIDTPYKPLKDYQVGVLYQALAQIIPPRARLIIQMPTGAGKTRTAVELITAFLEEATPGQAVIWLAHSEELCEQAFASFAEIWCHVAKRELTAFRGWGTHPLPSLDERSAFVVTSFQKLHAALKREPDALQELRDRVGLVIVDEAHKSVAPTYKRATKALLGSETRLVGLTATPGRTVEEESAELARFYFNTLVGIQTPDGGSVIRYLKEREILALADYDSIETRITFELTAKEREHVEQMLDFPPGFLKRVGADDVRNLEILRRLLSECEAGRRILVFACSIEQSKFLTAMLLYFEQEAAHIDGTTSKSRRREIIEQFRNGDIRVLCNYAVLSTGFDAPSTDVVMIARPTASPVLYSQMIGRGLRGPAIGGTARCKLIDVRDNIIGFGHQERVYDLFQDYFE
jgi:DNA repair protein RadD